jgi:hypothetical protein
MSLTMGKFGKWFMMLPTVPMLGPGSKDSRPHVMVAMFSLKAHFLVDSHVNSIKTTGDVTFLTKTF